MDVIEEIAKTSYESGAPKPYFDWDKVTTKDRAWYLRKAEAIFQVILKHGYGQKAESAKGTRKAFLALPMEERRRLLREQLMLMDSEDREAIRDLHKLD